MDGCRRSKSSGGDECCGMSSNLMEVRNVLVLLSIYALGMLCNII